MSHTVLHIVGARPNFMKMAPVLDALDALDGAGCEHVLVHTGQHYDKHLNDAIFRDLGLREPDVHLGVGSGTHAEQTSKIMLAFENLVAERQPVLIHVAGDVNSTLACSVVAAKAHVPIAHLEAGLRSFDMQMPEEINRIVTDRLASLHLTPSADGDENLRREGTKAESIVRIGNCMIDSLKRHLPQARQGEALARFKLEPGNYALATIHRPSNVDQPESLTRLLTSLRKIAQKIPIVLPVHPRTRARFDTIDPALVDDAEGRLHLCEPLGYLDFLQLQDSARLVMTDSGGVQEETTVLGVPCLTLRTSTERPVTVSIGSNKVIGTDPALLEREVDEILAGKGKTGGIPELWDGQAGQRAARALLDFIDRTASRDVS